MAALRAPPPAPKVVRFYPKAFVSADRPRFFVEFDHPIDSGILRQVRLEVGGTAVEVEPLSTSELTSDVRLQRLAGLSSAGHWVAFAPRGPLAASAPVLVRIGSGEFPRETTARLAVTRVNCRGSLVPSSEVCSPNEPFHVFFSTPVLSLSSAFDLIPTVAGGITANSGLSPGEVEVHGRFKAQTRYHVRVRPVVTDLYGQTLSTAWEGDLAFGDYLPYTDDEPPRFPFFVLGPASGDTVPIFSLGTRRELRVVVNAVEPEAWSRFRRYLHSRMCGNGTGREIPGTLASERILPRDQASLDDLISSQIPLPPAPRGGRAGSAIVMPGSRDERPTWVSRTDLSIDAFAASDSMTVWVSSLVDGRAVADAEVRLVPKGAMARTGRDGVATIALGTDTNAEGAIVVRHGDEVALLPDLPGLSDCGDYNPTGWRTANPAVDEPSTRVVLFDDGTSPSPGGHVRAKGWVRTILPLPKWRIERAALDALSWSLSCGRARSEGDVAVAPDGSFDLDVPVPVGATFVCQLSIFPAPRLPTSPVLYFGFVGLAGATSETGLHRADENRRAMVQSWGDVKVVSSGDTYAAGGSLVLHVASPFGPAEGLMVIRGRRVSTRALRLDSSDADVRIALDDENVPLTSVLVILQKPGERGEDGLPVRELGFASFQVLPADSSLRVEVTPSKSPGDPIEMRVSDAHGQGVSGATVTYRVVEDPDARTLAADPASELFEWADYRVRSWSLRDHVLPPRESVLEEARRKYVVNRPGSVSFGSCVDCPGPLDEAADWTGLIRARAQQAFQARSEPARLRAALRSIIVAPTTIRADDHGVARLTVPPTASGTLVVDAVAVAGTDRFGAGSAVVRGLSIESPPQNLPGP